MGNTRYCWKVNLTFACGCSESAPTVHLCSPGRSDCNRWLSNRSTTKICEYHRGATGLYSSSLDSGNDSQEETEIVLKVERAPGQPHDEATITQEEAFSGERYDAEQQRGTWEGYYLKKRLA